MITFLVDLRIEGMTDSLQVKFENDEKDDWWSSGQNFNLILSLIVLSIIIVNFIIISLTLTVWRYVLYQDITLF